MAQFTSKYRDISCCLVNGRGRKASMHDKTGSKLRYMRFRLCPYGFRGSEGVVNVMYCLPGISFNISIEDVSGWDVESIAVCENCLEKLVSSGVVGCILLVSFERKSNT